MPACTVAKWIHIETKDAATAILETVGRVRANKAITSLSGTHECRQVLRRISTVFFN